MQIKFKRITNFTGRNGYFKQGGLDIIRCPEDRVMLTPLTSIGNLAKCDMIIPSENLLDICKQFLIEMPIEDREKLRRYITRLP